MLKPLNYTTKAIEALSKQLPLYQPSSQVGISYIIRKLNQAQIFNLPDYGMILDRGGARPYVPEARLRPPFDVVAVEYAAPAAGGAQDPVYCPILSSRRIALVWKWDDADRPAFMPSDVSPGPGVAIASIAFWDAQRTWLLIGGALHLPDEGAWMPQPAEASPFETASVASGRMKRRKPGEMELAGTIVPLLPDGLAASVSAHGEAMTFDHLHADLSDEMNAYFDMCCALACRNVSFERHAASSVLNRARRGSGKQPLRDFHILNLAGEAMSGGSVQASGGGVRSHLRRGHIRRLSGDRVTWVNQTMVHGRVPGFVDKVYHL